MRGLDDIACIIKEAINPQHVRRIAERSKLPILVLGPKCSDIYDFLHTNEQSAVGFGMPAQLQAQSEVVDSYRRISKELDEYAFLISGVLGYEIGSRDIGPSDNGHEDAFVFFDRCSEKGVPVSILTESLGINVYQAVGGMDNLVYFGQRPTNYFAWAYILKCHREGRYIPPDEFLEGIDEESTTSAFLSQSEEVDFFLRR
jgi:hypothetical protein